MCEKSPMIETVSSPSEHGLVWCCVVLCAVVWCGVCLVLFLESTRPGKWCLRPGAKSRDRQRVKTSPTGHHRLVS